MQWVYLDNNATTRPAPEVTAAVTEAHEILWANPSSVHRFGQMVRQRLELARASVARLIGAKPRELVFTSGGTEADNLALAGVLDAGKGGALITTPIEHSAVREPGEALEQAGTTVVRLPIDGDGLVDPADLERALSEQVSRQTPIVLVSTQWANNETGVIQPIAEIAAVIRRVREELRGAGKRLSVLLHVDATQAVGKLPMDVKEAGVDLLTLAGHKFHGPKGTGALYVRTGVRLRPQQRGGPQEREKRGGTENTAGILGMGVAAELAAAFVADTAAIETLRGLRDRFERAVLADLPGTVVNSGHAPRLWNTSNLGFEQLEAEAILLALSERGVCASAGAACSSGSLEPSPVLLAMGIPERVAHGSVRFSLSRYTVEAELDSAARAVREVVERLRQTLPM